MQLKILNPDLLLVSVVVAEAADVVGGDVVDGAQHVLTVLHLQPGHIVISLDQISI